MTTLIENKMDCPRVVSQSEWLMARKKLFIQEKEATRQRDALSRGAPQAANGRYSKRVRL